MKDDTYYFHQTPRDIAKKIIDTIPFEKGDRVVEPFRGEGAFYDQFPDSVVKSYAEIEEGIDFRDLDYSNIDYCCSNPPFKLEDKNGKRQNSFWKIVDFFTQQKIRKQIILLANDHCLSTMTPRRLKIINDRGWYIVRIRVMNIKAWRGRYFLISFGKKKNGFYDFL